MRASVFILSTFLPLSTPYYLVGLVSRHVPPFTCTGSEREREPGPMMDCVARDLRFRTLGQSLLLTVLAWQFCVTHVLVILSTSMVIRFSYHPPPPRESPLPVALGRAFLTVRTGCCTPDSCAKPYTFWNCSNQTLGPHVTVIVTVPPRTLHDQLFTLHVTHVHVLLTFVDLCRFHVFSNVDPRSQREVFTFCSRTLPS